MLEPMRNPPDHDPLLAYIQAELDRPFAEHAIPEERDRHYRALLEDLRVRAEKATTSEERAFLARRANAVAHLRLEDARVTLTAAHAAAQQGVLPFGESLRRLRQRAGLSQSALAKRSNIDPAYVNRMEKAGRGESVIPSRNILLAIAGSLGLSAFDTDALLVSAGYAPLAVLATGGWRPEFALLAQFLQDPLLDEPDRAEFRQVLTALVVHWRGERTA